MKQDKSKASKKYLQSVKHLAKAKDYQKIHGGSIGDALIETAEKRTFAKMLKQKRKDADLSYRKLAEHLGNITHKTLREYEQGLLYPSFKVLERICKFFKLNLTSIYMTIQNERAPATREKYFIKPNIYFINPAKALSDLISPANLHPFRYNEYLIDSLVYQIEGNFMEPLTTNNQKIILSYSAPINLGDYLFCEINCTKGNYAVKVKAFKKGTKQENSITVKSGPDHIWGKLIAVGNNQKTIENPTNNKRITVHQKDIDLEARIMGVLF